MRGKNEWIWDARDEEAGVGLVTIPPTDAVGVYAPYPWISELYRVGNPSSQSRSKSASAYSRNPTGK